MPKTNDKLYRHYADGCGTFRTERYAIVSLKLIPSAYCVKPDSGGDAIDVPSAWVGSPRAAELWTTEPDPDKAYRILLESAEKDLANARGRLAVYEGLYEKIKNSERRCADE